MNSIDQKTPPQFSLIAVRENFDRWFLVFIVAVAMSYRLYDLDYLSLWADELWSLLDASRTSWHEMIASIINRDSHPPGYQTILYWWIHLAGKSDFMVRLPSAIAGIAAVLSVYKTGEKHFSRECGLFAALLLGGSYSAIYYSQEARAYSLLVFFYSLHISALLSVFFDKSGKYADLIIFCISAIAMLYLHYVGSVIFAAEALILLPMLCKDFHKMAARATLAFAVPLICYLPWLPVMYRHATTIDHYWSPKPTWNDFLVVWKFIVGNIDGVFYSQIIIVFLWLIFITVSLFFSRHKKNMAVIEMQKILACAVMLLLPMLILFAKSHFSQSIQTPRHFIYAIPLFCLLLGAAIAKFLSIFSANKLPHFLISALLATAIFGMQVQDNIANKLYKHSRKRDFREAVLLVTKDRAFMSSDRVIVVSHDFFNHYLAYFHVAPAALAYFSPVDRPAPAQYVVIREMIDALPDKDFYYMGVDDDGEIVKLFSKDYRLVCSVALTGITVNKFSKSPSSANDSCVQGVFR